MMTSMKYKRLLDIGHVFDVEYCYLQVRGKTYCFNFSSQLYDIHFVNIYLNILKYMKNLYFLSKIRVCCCCLSFELSAFANYVT